MINAETILDPEIADIPLSRLGLDEHISQLLIDNGYKTIGDIYGLQAEGITLVLSVDYGEAQLFWNDVLEVVSNPDEWGTEPAHTKLADDTTQEKINLTVSFPEWLKGFFASNRVRDYTILYRRYGLGGGNQETLEDIGVFFEVSRERVRQLQNKAVDRLHKFIFTNEPNQESEIRNEVIALMQAIQADGASAKLETELFQFLTTRYGTALTSTYEQHYRLLFTVFSWEGVSDKSVRGYFPEPFWIIDTERLKKSRILEAGKRIVRILQDQCVKIDYFTIKVSLNAKRQKRFSDLEIRTAIRVCPDIERFEDDNFQIAFNCLRSASDQAFRVLGEAGEPLSAKEIHREVSRRLALSGENIITMGRVSNSMASDSRFVPIGKSVWALVDWEDVTLGTIVEQMKQFFYEHNRPAKAKEIYEYVFERRKVSRNSISAYLSDHDDFIRVGRGLYQLSEWKVPKLNTNETSPEVVTRERLAELVVHVFDQMEASTMPAAQLIQELDKAGVGNSNIYPRLRQCPAVNLTVVSERPRRLEATVVRDFTFEKRITLRDGIEEAVREILSKQPDQSMPLFDLRNQIVKRGNIHAYTFYSYLSDMIEVQKNVVPGTHSVIVTLVSDEKDDGDEVKDAWDSNFTYDIAISYAGAQRVYAADLAEEFREKSLTVFYDRNQLPDLVGRNLLDELLAIYRDKARLCVILASEEYNKSPYAQHERQSAQDRLMNDEGYIVLVNLDGCQIKGFHSTVAYLDWNSYGLKKIAALAIEQLQRRM